MQDVTYTVPYDEEGNGAVTISAHYWEGTYPKGILLLHMMPATKESWTPFAEKLNSFGYHVLAPDLRGHGSSQETILPNGKHVLLNYTDFHDSEHQRTCLDVEKALNFLQQRGIPVQDITVGGASIGANLTIQCMSKHQQIKKGFALSPGLDYHSIKTEHALENMFLHQKLFLAAAEDDKYAAHSVNILMDTGSALKTTKLYKTGGHGTALFESHPELVEELTKWIMG